jgi:hypothetical protein
MLAQSGNTTILVAPQGLNNGWANAPAGMPAVVEAAGAGFPVHTATTGPALKGGAGRA